jgi:hypothetical protein
LPIARESPISKYETICLVIQNDRNTARPPWATPHKVYGAQQCHPDG